MDVHHAVCKFAVISFLTDDTGASEEAYQSTLTYTGVTNNNGYVPYRPQTISATNHIGLDHIGHTKRPYRPKGITISATKNVLLFSANIYKLSVEPRNVVHNPVRRSRISGEEKNATTVDIFQSALMAVYNC